MSSAHVHSMAWLTILLKLGPAGSVDVHRRAHPHIDVVGRVHRKRIGEEAFGVTNLSDRLCASRQVDGDPARSRLRLVCDVEPAL